ncbi:class I SAM-dependent methyltransferase [Candidatus Poribacteria bacterium]|nr:class I SAM-dependent methyltransferase [Candidatus Poribacteria bacterium]
MQVDAIKYAKNRAYQFVEEQQKALDAGRITEAQWFDNHKRYFTAAYLAADNPRAQSGYGGDEAGWCYSRGMIVEAVHKSGTFLDVGCANGHLIESLHQWLVGSRLKVEFSGLDISEELAELAKKRLPDWKDQIYIGNALYWIPQVKYDFVRTGLEYVPLGRQKDFIKHLLVNYVTRGGRLILGLYNEERDNRELEEKVCAWGYQPAGYCEKSKPDNEIVSYKMLWIDKN